MKLTKLKPTKALKLAFRKVKPQREQIETFKSNLINLLDYIKSILNNSCMASSRSRSLSSRNVRLTTINIKGNYTNV